ncbi:MAG: DinB family protein [Bacteroidetes bacterium]|nr:DinB family protein [Bacteroidota bacterium]
MSLQKFMANNANYHSWATQKFVEWLSPKSDELLHKEVPSSFNSIIKTLNHIWATDEYWYSIIAETSEFENRSGINEYNSKEIFDGIVHRANEISKLIASYNEEKLSKLVKIETPWFKCELPKYEYLQQLINHATYHRGQIVTIGRNVGITDGSNTDYNFYNIYK